MNDDSQLTEIRALLPWYANNTLGTEQHERVEIELKKNEALRAELKWLQSLQTSIRDKEITLPKQGLEKLMQRIASERSIHNKQPAWLKPAFAIAASLLIVQTVVMGYLITNKENLLQPLSGTVVSGAILQVTFRAGVTEQQIRELLIVNRGEIVGGPGALGIYSVRVSEDKVELVMRALQKQSAIVESVQRQK